MVKLGEFCGHFVRCQLPNGDLETLISIKSDDDFSNLIGEYDRAAPSSKIRPILSPPPSLKQISPSRNVNFPSPKPPPLIVFLVLSLLRHGLDMSSVLGLLLRRVDILPTAKCLIMPYMPQ